MYTTHEVILLVFALNYLLDGNDCDVLFMQNCVHDFDVSDLMVTAQLIVHL